MSPGVHGRGGIGRYVRELAAALQQVAPDAEYVGLCERDGYATGAALPGRMTRATHSMSDRAWRLYTLRSHFGGAAGDQHLPAVDLLHGTDNVLPRTRRIRTVMTLHDLAFRVFPEIHKPMYRSYLAVTMPRMLRRADAVIVISEATRRDAIRFYGLDEARLHVIYEGVGAPFRPAEAEEVARVRSVYGLPSQFLLYVGTIEPRKNPLTLLEAYRVLCLEGIDCPLVLAGKLGWRSEQFLEARRRSGLEQKVRLLGVVPDDDLVPIYSAADAFVFPSLYEGFGLPALEAIACGAPVICADSTSLPEVSGGAALLVSARDVGALAGAIRRLLSDAVLREELRARGLRRAAQFTWESSARKTLDVYHAVLAGV